jgi:hypothetical protein
VVSRSDRAKTRPANGAGQQFTSVVQTRPRIARSERNSILFTSWQSDIPEVANYLGLTYVVVITGDALCTLCSHLEPVLVSLVPDVYKKRILLVAPNLLPLVNMYKHQRHTFILN